MSGGKFARFGYGLSQGSPYYEWLWGKTIDRIDGFHTTDGGVIGLVLQFTDGAALHLVPECEPRLVDGVVGEVSRP